MIEPMQQHLALGRLSAAEQLAALVTGHAPRPVCGARGPSVAQLEEPRYLLDRVTVPRQCSRGRPRASQRPRVSGDAGYIRSICYKLQAEAIRGCNLDQIARVRWQRAEVPSAAAFQTQACCCLRDACIPMHGIRSVQLAGSPAVANRPAEAARCFEVACEPPDARLPSAICQLWRKLTAHTAGPYQYATNASFRSDGRDLLAPCASLPPHRWTPRGRMRGVGATCTAPTTHGRPKRMKAPECCQIGAA